MLQPETETPGPGAEGGGWTLRAGRPGTVAGTSVRQSVGLISQGASGAEQSSSVAAPSRKIAISRLGPGRWQVAASS